MRRRDLLTGLLATTAASATQTTAGLSMPAINDETNALASAISPAPSSTWLQLVDILITTLKQKGVWATLEKWSEDGVVWLYGVGEDGVQAFTDFGIENLIELIRFYKENPELLRR
jgi:hypothetical protein